MNKFTIIFITIFIIIGSFFGYRYYQNNQKLKETVTKENRPAEMTLSKRNVMEELAKKFEKNGRKIYYSDYPLYNMKGTLILIASVKTDMSASECIYSNKNGEWEEIGCHQNLLPCEMLDKAGMDRQTTIEFKCFEYDKQEYRLTDSSYKNNVTFKEDNKFVEIKDSKNKYSIKFANNYKLDITNRYDGYSVKEHGQKIIKKRLEFEKTGENFKLIYFPEYISPAKGMLLSVTEYQFEIQSFSGKMSIDKLKFEEGQIGGYTVMSKQTEKFSVKGKEAYRFYSFSPGDGIIHTIIVINENHYVMFSTRNGNEKSSYNKLYYEMIDSISFN